jgi:hypothetical protein
MHAWLCRNGTCMHTSFKVCKHHNLFRSESDTNIMTNCEMTIRTNNIILHCNNAHRIQNSISTLYILKIGSPIVKSVKH